MKRTHSTDKKKSSKHGNKTSSTNKFVLETLNEELIAKYITKIENTYKTTFKIYPNSVFINSKGKLFFSSLKELPTHLKRINSVGVYVGTLLNSGEIRLSLEGTQLLNTAKESYCIIKDESISSYVSGENLFFDEIEKEVNTKESPFIIIYDSAFQPLGVTSKKDEQKVYLNYISKGRKMDFNKVF